MVKVAGRELKNRLGKYLGLVRAGETVEITDRGRPVGCILPFTSPAHRRTAESLASLVAKGSFRLGAEKPASRPKPAVLRPGKSIAEMVVEDRALMLYLDTSALAKLYVIEPGGEGVSSVVAENEGRLFTSVATYAEVLSVLGRCLREKRISRRRYQLQKRAFLADWRSLHVVELTENVLAPAGSMIERFGLRGFDSVQLCSALWVGRPLFACFDLRLRHAAENQGLTLFPPSAETR